jgi:hypothetical protein
MAGILDLGTRIELTSMYPHFHDISIGLYERSKKGGKTEYQIHCYAARDGVDDCLRRLASAMVILGGMVQVGDDGRTVCFSCGSRHVKACKRVFIEACKVAPGISLEPKPLKIFDKKTERHVHVERLSGREAFRVTADGAEDGRARRIAAIAGGLVKLAEISLGQEGEDVVVFPCSGGHDSLVGLLLIRALNVRAAMREEDSAAGRGLLAAPSAQQPS